MSFMGKISAILWVARGVFGFETGCGHAHALPIPKEGAQIGEEFECYCESEAKISKNEASKPEKEVKSPFPLTID